jgi:hypothetical protein
MTCAGFDGAAMLQPFAIRGVVRLSRGATGHEEERQEGGQAAHGRDHAAMNLDSQGPEH